MVKAVGSEATPEVIQTWNEVYELYKESTGERKDKLQQVADRLGVSYKVARRRLRNYEAMNNIKPDGAPPPRRQSAATTSSAARRTVSGEPGDFQDRMLVCVDCDAEFPFSAREQAFFAEKGFQQPKRCKNCKQARKASAEGGRS